jgi:hypothetical protein
LLGQLPMRPRDRLERHLVAVEQPVSGLQVTPSLSPVMSDSLSFGLSVGLSQSGTAQSPSGSESGHASQHFCRATCCRSSLCERCRRSSLGGDILDHHDRSCHPDSETIRSNAWRKSRAKGAVFEDYSG